MAERRFDAIVIGAGANGLVAASALARAGRRTLVVERTASVGGQHVSMEFAPGFRTPLDLDAGWVPPPVLAGLGIALPARAHADPHITVAVAPGRFLSIAASAAETAAAIRPYSVRDAAAWPAFVKRLHMYAAFLEAMYRVPAPDLHASEPGELLRLAGLGRRLRALGRSGMTDLLRVLPMSVHELLDDTFECEPLKAALAAGGIAGIRQGPRSGGTAFVLLHGLAGAPAGAIRSRGFWRDGPNALVGVLETAARASGVSIRTGAAVSSIRVRDYAVTGVALDDGEEIDAPLVLSSADPARTLLGLVDPVWLDPEFANAVRSIKFRGSTAFVLYALDALPELEGVEDPARALAGVVSLTASMRALERAYDATKYGEASEAPHVELTAPSLRWPDLAPAGRHTLVARVQYVPHTLRTGVWDGAARDALADRVTRAIARVAPGFAERILHKSALTPAELEARFAVTEGALSHGELTLDQILFMRPIGGRSRYALPIAGLYLCGAGTHPGPGIPGGPGWLAARAALGGRS